MIWKLYKTRQWDWLHPEKGSVSFWRLYDADGTDTNWVYIQKPGMPDPNA